MIDINFFTHLLNRTQSESIRWFLTDTNAISALLPSKNNSFPWFEITITKDMGCYTIGVSVGQNIKQTGCIFPENSLYRTAEQIFLQLRERAFMTDVIMDEFLVELSGNPDKDITIASSEVDDPDKDSNQEVDEERSGFFKAISTRTSVLDEQHDNAQSEDDNDLESMLNMSEDNERIDNSPNSVWPNKNWEEFYRRLKKYEFN